MAIAAQVDITDLAQNLAALLERVRVGEEVIVLEHGTAVARLVPPSDPRAAARAALLVLRAGARVGAVESAIGEPWEAADDHP